MVKMKRLKPTLAVLLAAAMALSGPAQSAGLVHAEETVVQEQAEASEVERERADGEESRTVQTQEAQETMEVAALETQPEKETVAGTADSTRTQEETQAADVSVEETQTVTETGDSASDFTQEQQETVEETTQEGTQETGTATGETQEEETTQEETEEETEEETTQEADELKISGTEMHNAAPLSVGKNEITVKKDETGKWYYFEPKEDGAYYVSLSDYEHDCILKKSGVKKSLYDRKYYDDYPCEELFFAKAGERVYFQPCFESWYYSDEEYENKDLSTPAVIMVRAASKGSVSKESDGNYTLSYASGETKVNLSLVAKVLNTTIDFTVENKDKTDDRGYSFYAYCAGETYGKGCECYIRGYASGVTFSGLDMDETYHIDYIINNSDVFVWFEGTDLTTASTDKIGGVISNITAGFADIVVDYELFHMDTSEDCAYIRYRKDGVQEWVYDEIYVDEQTAGSTTISFLDMETQYIIELVSSDKKTIYDSRRVTTGKYEGKVTVSVNQDSITAESVGISVTGYDTKDDTLNYMEVHVQYTDDWNGEMRASQSFWSQDEAFQSGTVTFSLSNLIAGTEYKNVRISVLQRDKQWKSRCIYAGTLSFTTKESPIKAENIKITMTPTGFNTALVRAEMAETAQGVSLPIIQYRKKGTEDWSSRGKPDAYGWEPLHYDWEFYGLEEADYELQFKIGGIIKQQEVHFTPMLVEDDVKAQVKVKNTFVNGLEIEAALTGVEANSEDLYTCDFQVAENSGSRWVTVSTKITLDATKPITKKIDYWNVHPGEKLRWRYVVYKNGLNCYIGYLDTTQTQTKPLELDILSVELDTHHCIEVSCKVKNWSEVIQAEGEDNKTNIGTYAFIRKKGEEKWEALAEMFDFYFDKDGTESVSIILYDEDYEYITLDPSAQYELCIASSTNDEHVVYAQTAFQPIALWEIPEENNFVYNSANTRRSIMISGNYNKPTVEVENENVVSVREIRQSRIYLDIHNVGTTTLDVTADGITKTITVNVTPSAETLFFFEGADESLKDLTLPSNYTWVNPSESPKADNENKIQYFDVTIKETDGTKYGKVPVAVSTLEEDKIEIQGKDTIGFGKDAEYGAYCTGTGYVENFYAEAQAYEITHEWTGDDGLVIKNGGKDRTVTVTGSKAGEHELTLTVKVKSFQTGKSLERKQTLKINVLGEGLIDNIVILPAKEQPDDAIPAGGYLVTGSVVSGQVIEINCEEFDISKNNKLQFEAKTDKGVKNEAGEPVLEDISVQWVGESILDVNENGLVTIKDRGEGTLRVTAKDDGKYSAPILFKVYNACPNFKSTEYIVRIGSKEGTRLSYEEREGSRVTKMAVSGNDKFETIQHDGDHCWYLRTTEKADYTKETTEQITLKITMQNEKTYEQALTVTILPEPKLTVDADTSTGTVTFSQTEIPNLFYVNSEAVFQVTNGYEGYEIEDIRTIEKDKDVQNFHVKSYDAKEKTITLTANKLDSSTVTAFAAKNSPNAVANVEVKFKGYDGYYPKDGKGIQFAVAVQNKPVSALKAEDAFVTGSINTAQVDVLDKKTVFDLSGAAFEPVTNKTKAQISAAVENGRLKLTQTGEKDGKYTFNVTNPNWTKTLTLTGKISKVDVKKLTMKASKTKATLNTKYKDSVIVNVSVKGNASLPVVIDKEVKPATDALAIVVSEDNKRITFGVAEGKTLAAGKYTISIAGKIGEEKTKATKLTLTVTDKEPEVKLSAKGSINILNRDLSGITYTATIKNTDAGIKSVELTDDSVLTFKIAKGNEKTFVLRTLKDAAAIDTKKPYEVKVKLTLSNGAVIKDTKGVTLKVKPTDKLPKVKINAPKKPAVSKAQKNSVAVKLDMEAGYRLAKIELDGKDKEKFAAAINGQSAFTISLAPVAGEVAPKAYTVKYKLYFEGANTTTKPMTKSIKITVNE